MATLMQASREWRTRPNDQRFTSLTALNARVQSFRKASVGKVINNRQIEVRPVEGDDEGLCLVGPNGGAVGLTHWSFNQLASRCAAPAAFLRDLPGALAADNLNYMIQRRDSESLGVLLHRDEGGANQLRAVTGPNYGRVWNATITQSLVKRFGDGLTGKFRVPGEFGKAVAVTQENTTLYASDRDMFVFLADEERRITINNRRDGKPGSLARGFFIWNSEVGASSFGISTFLFDYVCCNRIVWGADNVQEIRLRHSSNAPERWIDELIPAIDAYSESSAKGVEDAVKAAQAKSLGNEMKVDEFLKNRFSRSQSVAIKAAHMADEQRPIETLWDVATGVTAYARLVQWQDERVNLEREAGKILNMAVK